MRTDNRCFGIFSFSETLKNRFDQIIKPIVETHTGLSYWDARKLYEPQNIKMATITRMIEEARFTIIDVSELKANVFIEIGIAFALNKRIVFLCSEKKHVSVWRRKIPFDLQGREFLIYKDDNDLKVRLGEVIFDAVHETFPLALSWWGEPKDGVVLNHIKSATELELRDDSIVWSSSCINAYFSIQYRARLGERRSDAVNKPDLRLYIAPSPESGPRVVCILPWENPGRPDAKLECHIDYFCGRDSAPGPIYRLQQTPVCSNESRLKDFKVFVSFCYPKRRCGILYL
jgi:hypothetical protein